jgi:hypothetical protein
MCPNQQITGQYAYGTLFIQVISGHSAGNITVETYDFPSEPVAKSPCVEVEDGGASLGCLQDGVLYQLDVTEDEAFTPFTYTYTFCKFRSLLFC